VVVVAWPALHPSARPDLPLHDREARTRACQTRFRLPIGNATGLDGERLGTYCSSSFSSPALPPKKLSHTASGGNPFTWDSYRCGGAPAGAIGGPIV
jgi:hypothetical protein